MSWTSRFSFRTLLTAMCLAFALVPLVVVMCLVWRAANTMAEHEADWYQSVAAGVSDKIDRNLFERYGDVQAFGVNQVVRDQATWGQPGDANPIVSKMNQYVDLYDVYYLTMLVDLNGKLAAVNTKDHNGKSIDTAFLYERNFANDSWFRDAIAGRFYQSQDGSFTGTVVEHLYTDEAVQRAYADEGLALGFTAPVRDANGQVIAVWKNVTKFSLVEDIVLCAYRDLAENGLSSAELTLLDERGCVIVDCHPGSSSAGLQRDLNVIGKLNLADDGLEVAQLVVAGNAGSSTSSFHLRRRTRQVAGFTPLRGAMGFPGMRWNMLLRADHGQALAAVNQLKFRCLWAGGLAAALILGGTFTVSRRFSRDLSQVTAAMEAAARQDYSLRVSSRLASDLCRMTDSLGKMQDSLQQAAQDHQQRMTEREHAMKLSAVVNCSEAAIVMIDRDFVITYLNEQSQAILTEHLDVFRSRWPQFDPQKLLGACIDQFHTNPQHVRSLTADPKKLPYSTDIQIGPLTFALIVHANLDETGAYIGNTLVWRDVTEVRRQTTRAKKNVAFQEQEVVKLSAVLNSVAAGDLTTTYQVTAADEDTAVTAATFEKIATAINGMTDNLQTIISGLAQDAGQLAATSNELSATATQLAGGAEETTSQSASAAAAAEEMSTNMRNMAASTEEMTTNVKTVATSVRELNSSIGEIARTATHASTIAGRAAQLTKSSNDTIGELGAAAEEIGKVIEVIQDIAEQTNLLALNATIEAARAGEAGKGFAVVATEVKELARQTAGATEGIRQRIQAMQNSTLQAVAAIREVGDVIEQVNQTASTIASAVEEQSIITRGINDNVSQTAQAAALVAVGVTESATACDEVAHNIANVDQAAKQTATGASQTQIVGRELSRFAADLQGIVQQFHVKDAADSPASGRELVGRASTQRSRQGSPGGLAGQHSLAQ